jgi:hypothetical protein
MPNCNEKRETISFAKLLGHAEFDAGGYTFYIKKQMSGNADRTCVLTLTEGSLKGGLTTRLRKSHACTTCPPSKSL